MVRQTTKVIVVEVLGMISLLVMAACAVLAFMLANGPVNLGVFRDDVERALANARGGRDVSVDLVTLQWSPSERRLFVVANGLSFKDGSGREAARAHSAELSLDAGAIFLGDIEVHRIQLADGWLNVQNIAPNRWSVAGDPLPDVESGALPATPREWLDRTNSTLSGVLRGLEAMQGTMSLESISFRDMEVRFLAMDGGELGRLTKSDGGVQRIENDIQLSIAGEGGGVGLPGQLSVSLSTLQNYEGLQADLMVDAWPIADLAGRLGLSGFDEGDLTAGISFGSSISRNTGIEQIDVRIARDSGSLALPVIGETIRDIGIDLSYALSDDAVVVNALDIRTDRIMGTLTGRLDHVLAENELRKIVLAADDLQVDMRSYFPEAWNFQDVSLTATSSDDFTVFAVERAEWTVGNAKIQATGEIDTDVEHADGELPFQLSLAAELIGDFDRDMVLAFWPESFVDGARRFVDGRVLGVKATEANVTLDLKPDSFAEGFLRDGDLDLKFSFTDAEVKFLSDVPSIREGIGTGRLTGDTFSIIGTSALYDDWQVDSVDVDFPVLNERGAPFTVTAIAQGPAVSVLRTLSNSRLKLQEQTGFDPERIAGDARATFKMVRPSLDNVPFEDTALEVRGTIENGSLQSAIGETPLTNANVQVDMNNDRLIITGFGDIGPAPVQFTWRDALIPDELPADLSATAVLTTDVLNSFGLLGRAYLSGEIPVEMQGKVAGQGISEAAFAFDLRDARIDIAEIGWIKPAGSAARATLTYSGDLRTQASSVRLESEDARLDGDVLLGDDLRLQSLTLRQLFLRDIANVAGTLERMDNGGIAVALTGPYLDISPMLGDLGSVGGSGGEITFPMQIDAEVEQLRLRRGLDLSGATATLESTTEGLKSASASGQTSTGAPLSAAFQADEAGGAPRITLSAGDAGFLAAAFLGLDFVSGGELQLSGTLASGNQPARLLVEVEDARLRNAPFITQILSLASLRGLTDTLSGEGVLFTKIEAPITVGGGRYIIEGGRASGPALGLTVNGWIGLEGDGIEIDGVLVPSFGVNSMLGGVPVIGDLFVGRRGEGIFSITYAVRGSLQKAQVSVNPLSAVTPGILRRIFENPSDTSIPESLPVDPNLKPPSEKLPDLPDEEYIEPTPGGG